MIEAIPPFSSLSSHMGHGRRLVLPLFLLSIPAVRAHDHQVITEEMANAPVDAMLWIHIFLQASVWGILFPIGMVLGLSRSRWHVPLQVRRSPAPFCSSSLSKCVIGHGYRAHSCWLHPGARTRRQAVPCERTWRARKSPPRCACYAVHTWRVPQTAHTRTNTAALGRARAWRRRKVIPRVWVDADAVWRDRVSRVLSG